MGIENPNNLPEKYVDPQLGCEEDLVLPKYAAPDLITAADMLTALGIGNFRMSETDLNDPDGIRVRYRGDRNFTDFTSLAYTYTQEVKNGKNPLEAAHTAGLKHPKSHPKGDYEAAP